MYYYILYNASLSWDNQFYIVGYCNLGLQYDTRVANNDGHKPFVLGVSLSLSLSERVNSSVNQENWTGSSLFTSSRWPSFLSFVFSAHSLTPTSTLDLESHYSPYDASICWDRWRRWMYSEYAALHALSFFLSYFVWAFITCPHVLGPHLLDIWRHIDD